MARVIQVGVGHWGFDWASTVLPTVETVEPVAFVDASPAALERLKRELGIDGKRCFPSLDAALGSVDADLVLATLRTEAHYPITREALQAGLNVIVEKPFASTVEEAAELVALAEARNRVLMVSQNYRFFPAPVLAAELVAAKTLGALQFVAVDFRNHAPTAGYRYWDFPDPLIADMSVHHFDLMRMVLADEPRRVSCRTWNAPGSRFVHDPIGVATIEFRSGAIVSYRGSWLSAGATTPWAGEWTMDFSEGEIWWTSRDRFVDHQGEDRLIIRRRDAEPEAAALPELPYLDRAGTLAAAAAATDRGVLPDRFSSGRDNLHSLALVRASSLSAARDGDWVDIAEVLPPALTRHREHRQEAGSATRV